MNYGIVDLGSNSIRLSIYEVQDGQPRLLINKKEMAGLAGYVSGGILEETGIERACAALESFHEILGHFGIKEMHAFATASLRNIENRSEAVAEIARRTGVRCRGWPCGPDRPRRWPFSPSSWGRGRSPPPSSASGGRSPG